MGQAPSHGRDGVRPALGGPADRAGLAVVAPDATGGIAAAAGSFLLDIILEAPCAGASGAASSVIEGIA